MPFSSAYNIKFGYRPIGQTNVGISDGCSTVGGSGPYPQIWSDTWTALTTNLNTMDLNAYSGDGSLSIRPSGSTYADVSSGENYALWKISHLFYLGQDMNDNVDKVSKGHDLLSHGK